MSNILPIRKGVDPEQPRTERAAAPIVTIPQPITTQTVTVCPICHGDGWLRVDVPHGHPQFGKPVKCRCKDAELRAKYVAMCFTWLMPYADESALETKTLDGFDPYAQPQHAVYGGYVLYARRYAARLINGDGVENALLKGSYGTGKTHLACGILNVLREAGVECLYCSVPSLFDALYDSNFDQRPIRLASQTRLLVLDEIDKLYFKSNADKEQEGGYQKGVLRTIIDARYKAGIPTIIITNKQEDLTRWLEGSALSRFKGRCEELPMNGADYRQRKGN